MTALFYVISSIILISFTSFLLYLKIKQKYDFANEKIKKVLKVFAVVYIILMFINLFLPDGFAVEKTEEFLKNYHGIYENTIRWLNGSLLIVIPLVAFYDNKYLNKIASYLCLPISLIYLYSYSVIIKSLTDPSGRGLNSIRFTSDAMKAFLLNDLFRTLIFGLLSILPILILIVFSFKNLKDLKFNKSEVVNFILITLGIILISLSSYTPQYYFGYTNLIFKRFTLIHLAVISFMVLEIIILYRIFKNKPQEIKRILLIALSISLMFQFSQVYTGSSELRVQKFPFQLCNIGSYLMLITLMTKNERLFHFTIIVNVVGAMIALIMLDVNKVGIASYWNIHYILEHTKVIIIPILCLLLKEFKPLEKKDVKDFLIGFLGYFLFVWIFGTINNAIYYHTNNTYFENNYLFMFNQKTAQGLLPIAGKLFDVVINIGPVKIFPVVQILVYLVFNILCIGVFYLIYVIGKPKKISL